MTFIKQMMPRYVASMTAGIVAAAMAATCAFAPVANADAVSPTQETIQSTGRHFMVYYRAWRDVTMKGVNTDLPDDNWISMYDIPYGVDVVNIFSYVPSGQEEQAQPFYDKLKSDYAPYLHSRGIKLVRGIDYTGVAVNGFRTFMKEQNKTESEATEADYDAYAKQVIDKYMISVGLDGLDIDMEAHPNDADVKISDNVIRALSKHIGPKSAKPDTTMFLYDTNGSYLNPFKNVAECFDYVAYQQYGSSSDRTARAAADYQPYIGNEFVPGLTFPEEGDMNNRWYDATEPYEESHFYQVASYVREHNLGGMFVYALDRDGRNYDEDLRRIVPSNLLWTKTAIAESEGMALDTAKTAANHYLDRMSLRQVIDYNAASADKARDMVGKAANLYETNKAVLGGDYGEGFSNTYDPTLEAGLLGIDISVLQQQIDKSSEIIGADTAESDAKTALRMARDAAIDGLTGKIYTADQVSAWSQALKVALDATVPVPTPDSTDQNGNRDKVTNHKVQGQPKQLSATGISTDIIVAVGVTLAIAGVALSLSRKLS